MRTKIIVLFVCLGASLLVAAENAAPSTNAVVHGNLPIWAIGPFTQSPVPVIKPNPEGVFHCPVQNANAHWEASWVYNPAAVVHEVKTGKLVATKINGRYWMYFG
jgi:hypothetical protein